MRYFAWYVPYGFPMEVKANTKDEARMKYLERLETVKGPQKMNDISLINVVPASAVQKFKVIKEWREVV